MRIKITIIECKVSFTFDMIYRISDMIYIIILNHWLAICSEYKMLWRMHATDLLYAVPKSQTHPNLAQWSQQMEHIRTICGYATSSMQEIKSNR